MKAPIVGISGSVDTGEKQQFILRDYMRAILNAGGIPVLLSMDMDESQTEDCLGSLDGLLLAGGNDISPELFGEEPVKELGEVNPLRDSFEMRLVRLAYKHGMPTLGICRGIQSMAVAMGGRLYQDLPTQRGSEGLDTLVHSQEKPYNEPSHEVSAVEGSLLYRSAGIGAISVNSMHHQAVREPLPPRFAINALSRDGVIEGIEALDKPFFMGIQWHPERMFESSEAAHKLFMSFVDACATSAAAK